MRADCAVSVELPGLFVGDELRREQAFDAMRLHRPLFTAREGLAQVGEVGERRHRVDPRLLQLIARRAEVELTFEVMQAGLQERLTVQRAPQTDRTEAVSGRQRLVREVLRQLFGRHVHIGEDDDPGDGMLDHLRAPARLASGVEPLAALETEVFEKRDQRREARAARTVRVMIVIGPAQPQRILPRFLNPSRPVASQPVLALGDEEQLARAVSTQIEDRRIDELPGVSEPVGIVIEIAAAQAQALQMAGDLRQRDNFIRVRFKRERRMSLDDPQLDIVLVGDAGPTQRGERLTFDLDPRQAVCGEEIDDRLHLDCQLPRRPRVAAHAREQPERMLPHFADRARFQGHRLVVCGVAVTVRTDGKHTRSALGKRQRGWAKGSHISDMAQFGEGWITSGQTKVIEPVEQPRSRFVEHPFRQARRERIASQTVVEQRLNELRRLGLRRPSMSR